MESTTTTTTAHLHIDSEVRQSRMDAIQDAFDTTVELMLSLKELSGLSRWHECRVKQAAEYVIDLLESLKEAGVCNHVYPINTDNVSMGYTVDPQCNADTPTFYGPHFEYAPDSQPVIDCLKAENEALKADNAKLKGLLAVFDGVTFIPADGIKSYTSGGAVILSMPGFKGGIYVNQVGAMCRRPDDVRSIPKQFIKVPFNPKSKIIGVDTNWFNATQQEDLRAFIASYGTYVQPL